MAAHNNKMICFVMYETGQKMIESANFLPTSPNFAEAHE